MPERRIAHHVVVHHSHCGATTALIRSHAGTPTEVNIFGYFYNINTGTLTEVVTDKAEAVEQV